jgi:hypothetical protein
MVEHGELGRGQQALRARTEVEAFAAEPISQRVLLGDRENRGSLHSGLYHIQEGSAELQILPGCGSFPSRLRPSLPNKRERFIAGMNGSFELGVLRSSEHLGKLWPGSIASFDQILARH